LKPTVLETRIPQSGIDEGKASNLFDGEEISHRDAKRAEAES